MESMTMSETPGEVIMGTPTITVTNLCDEKLEEAMKKQLESVTEAYPGWRVCVTVPQNSDNWQVYVVSPSGARSPITEFTLYDNKTIRRVVETVIDQIAFVQAEEQKVRVPNRETKAAIEAAERGEAFRASSVAEIMADLNADD
jgi:hypothetical protein